MNPTFFEHIKHRLSETAVPDPDQGWQQMNVLLDNSGGARKLPMLRWWYAAACLLLVSAGWALFHQHAPSTAPVVAGNAVSKPALPGTSAATPASQEHAARSGDAATVTQSGSEGVRPGSTVISAHASLAAADAHPVSGASGNVPSPPSANGMSGNFVTAISGVAANVLSGNSFKETSGAPTTGLSGNSAKVTSGAAAMSDATPNGLSFHSATSINGIHDLQYAPVTGNYLMDIPRDRPIASNFKPKVIPVSPVRSPLHLPRWGFEIGLGANAPGSLRKITKDGHSTVNLGIYPIVFADYRLTRRWTIKAGLAAPAPVAYFRTYTHTMVSATINDTSQSTQTVSENKKIGRLLYLDIPVTAEFAVFPHFTVEAGMQISHLLTEQEDTRTASSISPGFIAYATNALPNQAVLSQTHNTQQVRKTDPRYLLGANYQLHRFSAGLQYQGGLLKSVNQTDEDGNVFSNRTSIVRMQINYQLR